MTQQLYSPTRDLTSTVRMTTPTGPHLLLFLCSHKGLRAGSHIRGRLLLRCPKCNEAKA
jgi:hypothetical protein